MKMQKAPSFDEDNFDINEHKKAATTQAKIKAFRKRAHRKITVGRVVVWVVALAVCVTLYLMASTIVALF